MPLTQLPPAPSILDPENFSEEADAFVAALSTLVTELNAIIGLTIPAGSAAAGSLTGGTIAANVLASSLTSLGTLASLVVSGNATVGNLLGNLPKVGSFTRVLSVASGSQAITGVGFRPKAVIFVAGVASATPAGSVGFSDATAHGALINYPTAGQMFTSARCIDMVIDLTPNEGYAVVASLDADGFTLTWTKVNSPTATATIYYLALR